MKKYITFVSSFMHPSEGWTIERAQIVGLRGNSQLVWTDVLLTSGAYLPMNKMPYDEAMKQLNDFDSGQEPVEKDK